MYSNSFFTFMKEQEELLRANEQFKTAASYECALNSFFQFRRGEDISLDDITTDEMKDYQSWLKQRGVVSNTSSFYMRVLRAAYNKAVVKKMTVQQSPFESVYTGIGQTQKRALSTDLIHRLKSLDMCGHKGLEYARDLFMFSFYTRGMSFVDMAFLRKLDVRDGEIVYSRRKTGQKLMIGLEPCMEEIIEKYQWLTADSDYVLPILSPANPRSLQVQYYNALRYQNIQLKKIEKLLETPGLRLTSYVARHSWPSIARNKGISITVISEGMGHSSEKTTRIYLASLSQVTIDEANQKILSDFL